MLHIRAIGAIAILIACALAIHRGWTVTRFAMIEADISQTRAEKTARLSFFSVRGLESLAREAALKQEQRAVDKKDASKRLDELANFLSTRPLSSALWLSLAKMRAIMEAPAASVIGPLMLSDITGGYEERSSIERIAFSLSRWEDLPTELRNRIISELAVLFSRLESWHKEPLRKALLGKTQHIRQEIATALVQTGRPPAERLREIGL